MSKNAIQMTDEQGNQVFPINTETGNGWIRFADGLQIVYGEADITTTSSSNGAFDFTGGTHISFSKEFAQGSAPFVFTNVLESAAWWNSSASVITNEGCNLYIGGDNINQTRTVHYFAIGRWK